MLQVNVSTTNGSALQSWPAAQWPRDMANLRKLGLEFVHMGEFAWAFMEPSEGQFDFAWLDRNIARALERGRRIDAVPAMIDDDPFACLGILEKGVVAGPLMAGVAGQDRTAIGEGADGGGAGRVVDRIIRPVIPAVAVRQVIDSAALVHE